MEKDSENGNIFKIDKVNLEKFPQFEGIKKNDLLIYINNTPTNFLKNIDMYYWLDTNGQELRFTIKTTNNE